MPDKAKEKKTEGVVVAAGPGKVNPDTGNVLGNECTVGKSVLYGQFDGSKVGVCCVVRV